MATGTGGRRAIRWVGAGQFVVLTALAGGAAGSHAVPMWRPTDGCLGQPAYTICVAERPDIWGRLVGAVVAAVIGVLAIAAAGRRRRRTAGALALVVLGAGAAVFSAERSRWAGPHDLICYPVPGGGCAYPPWHVRSLLLGAAVGLVVGAICLCVERAGRAAARRDEAGLGHLLAAGVATVACLTGVFGTAALLALVDASDYYSRAPWAALALGGLGTAAGWALLTAARDRGGRARAQVL